MTAYDLLEKTVSNKFLIIFAVVLFLRNFVEVLLHGKKIKDNMPDEKRDGNVSVTIFALGYFVSVLVTLYLLFIADNINSISFMAGTLLLIIGYYGRVLGVRDLGINYTLFIAKPKDDLVTSGIYSYIRHPIYLFFLIEMSAFIVIEFSYISLFSLLFVTFAILYRIKAEDRLLSELYGEKFKSYCNNTKRIIPFIY